MELARDGVEVTRERALDLVALVQGHRDPAAVASRGAGALRDAARLIGVIPDADAQAGAAVLTALGFATLPGDPGVYRLGSAQVETGHPQPMHCPRGLTLDVPDLDSVHDRLRKVTEAGRADENPTAPVHIGMIGPADSARRRRQFVIHLGIDEFMTVREATADTNTQPRASGADASERTPERDIVASVHIRADGYRAMGGPAVWLKAQLFDRATGVRMASAASAEPEQAPWARPRLVTGGRRRDDPYEVELGEFIWQGNGSRDLDLLVTHAPGVDRSRLALQSTRLGDEDVIQLCHGGWTTSNLPYRAAYLDWQARLTEWANAL